MVSRALWSRPHCRRGSVSEGTGVRWPMLFVCGFDGEKRREFPSDSFSFQLPRGRRTLRRRRRSWHFEVIVESKRAS